LARIDEVWGYGKSGDSNYYLLVSLVDDNVEQLQAAAEFVREQNQGLFAKLNAIQDAPLMRSSSQHSTSREDAALSV
jgi:hypothetical protein